MEFLLSATDPERLPRACPDAPRARARLKAIPEDFLVDEVPLYPPDGAGQHRMLRVRKRDVAAGEMLNRLSRALGVPREAIGIAGAKDRRAVTTQWVTVPAECEPGLTEGVVIEGIEILERAVHGRKLRPGHLLGNRFTILLRGADPVAIPALEATTHAIASSGFPNLFGDQRFGREGRNVATGLAALGLDPGGWRPRLGGFERRMVVSAVQSALFNAWVAERLARGLGTSVLAGDVMSKVTGGMFRAVDATAEQARLDAGEIRITGPMFGTKMMEATGEAGELERVILGRAGLTTESFRALSKLAQGTRRPLWARPEDLSVEPHADGIRLAFFLPKGSYATVLLREFVEGVPVEDEDSSPVDEE
jgi:tRNA pseudouridine13 synthase